MEKFGLGALPPKTDIREFVAARCTAPTDIVIPEEYEIENMPAVKNQGSVGSCFDDKTEVLTRDGWKFFKDISYKDKLASVEPDTGKLIFEVPTDILTYDYSGDMVVGKHRHGLDFKVTPNHKMVVRTFNSQTKKLNDNYEFVDASDLGWWSAIRTDFHHITDEDAGSIVFKEEKIANGNILPKLEIDMHLWVQFLGIYLAEGCFDQDGEKYHNRIQLAAVKQRERNYIKQLLTNMGLHVEDCYKDRFFIYNKRIRNKLEEYGLNGVKSYNKFIPDFIFDLDETYIKEFLYAFSMGDGHINKLNKTHYYTSSSKLSEQLQILLLMSGEFAKIIPGKWKNGHLDSGRIIETKHQPYIITTRKQNISINKKHNISIENYEGKVYCAEVPTYHTLITRRKGVILMCGNCVAHAISTTIEYFNQRQENTVVKMSTGYIYGNRTNSRWTGAGMYVDDALATVVQHGDVPNSLFNINVEIPEAIEKFTASAFELSDRAYPNRFTSFFRLTTAEDMKISLLQNGPIVFSIRWYNTYRYDRTTGMLVKDDADTTPTGGHCMVIYGWTKDGWKFQNSWGTSWGNKGRAILPYSTPLSTCYGVIDTYSEKARATEIETLNTKLQEALTNLTAKETEIAELTGKLQSLTTLVEESNASIKEAQGRIDAITKDMYSTNNETTAAQTQLDQYNTTKSELKKKIKSYKKEITKYETSIAEANTKLTEATASGATEEELNTIAEEIISLQTSMVASKEKLATATTNLEEINSLIDSLKKSISDFSIKLDELEAHLSVSKTEYNLAVEKAAELTTDNAELSSKYENALSEIKGYTSVIEEQKNQITILQNQLLEVEKPYSNCPKFIVHIINAIINLFKKKTA